MGDDDELLRRATFLARLPGVKRKEVCERFDLSPGRLRRAMKGFPDARPTRRDIVLHVISRAGTVEAGALPDLSRVASYLDYVNKDGSTADQIRALLEELADAGRIALDDDGWRLLRPFP